jgi:hypothetical protein
MARQAASRTGRAPHRGRGAAPTATAVLESHRDWLAAVDTDGPFLSAPVLRQHWPQGMPRLGDFERSLLTEELRPFSTAWDAWDRTRNDATLEAYRVARDAFVDVVLRDVVGWGDLLVSGDAGIVAFSPNRTVEVRPTATLTRDAERGALVLVVDPLDSLHSSPGDGWAASALDRMEALLRAGGVRIGVVTDGRWWALVHVGGEALPASGVVNALDWVAEARTRDAWMTLLDPGTLVLGDPATRLPELFVASTLRAEDITVSLGVQVRRAVELLVAAFSEAGAHARETGAPDPLPEGPVVYEAAVTVMMRVVFLLFAQERGLLPETALFSDAYGLAGCLDDLDARARAEHEESLDATTQVWHRLLATSRLLHQGSSFEDLRMPSYGGSLFDPVRFPFLTDTTSRGLVVRVSDRVMLHVLRSVQVAVVDGEARRLSFRDIDVEQIGYIYEGLLGYSAQVVDEVHVGLIGQRSAKRLEGEEPEIALALLEEFAASASKSKALAERVLAHVKESQPGAKAPTVSALTKALDAVPEQAEALLRVVAPHDEVLRDRVRPFLGAIRLDLRSRPVVVVPGGLLVVETPSRRNAGAHYTPKKLAEEVVTHALAPLVYSPGPHETADASQWVLRDSTQILALKVADIACGSGAFLVAAARYLADRVIEAWRLQGRMAGRDEATMRVTAIRHVVASCLYGADINAMAVEMCKLSLWLVSLDRGLPFSFVDDKVFHGNSLLGLTHRRQVERLHIDPPPVAPGYVQTGLTFSAHDNALVGVFETVKLEERISSAIRLRQGLTHVVEPNDPERDGAAMRRQTEQSRAEVAPLARIADGVVAAGLRLGGKPGTALDAAYEDLRLAVQMAWPEQGAGDDTWLDRIIAEGLTPTVDTDEPRWRPLHWVLEVPDVMAGSRPGFDAIIGNPPFLGGKKVSGAIGSNAREWLVNQLADGAKGNADLVAYFFLRAQGLLKERGTIGLIATNTIAQGDTREVGLDRMVESGLTITQAIQSRSWPAKSANLEYAAVWGSVGPVADDVPRVCDDIEVARISPLLEPEGRVTGNPVRLGENVGVAFIGSNVNCVDEFCFTQSHADEWLVKEPRLKPYILPYLTGADVNSGSGSATRWIADFTGTPGSPPDFARGFWESMKGVILPARLELLASKPRLARDWWRYESAGTSMRRAIADLEEVLVIALVSKTVMPVRVQTGQVFSHALGVFATGSFGDQAVLSSALHQTWAIKFGSGMRNDPRYTPSDVFETFPRPAPTQDLERLGRVLDEERREIMLRRDLGLTKLYNLVNDPTLPDAVDPDVARMRAIHRELDEVVVAAYGWGDVALDHGFHTYRQMTRWTVSPAARIELLDRLLEENHRRAALQDAPPPTVGDDDEVLGDD